MASTAEFMRAIDSEDISALQALLDHEPALLKENLKWDNGYSGFALNYAAFRNKADVVEYLVREQHADPNSGSGVSNGWTPLHHAEKMAAHKAAGRLLQLGADPKVKNESGKDTVAYAKSQPVAEENDPAFKERQKKAAEAALAKRIAGSWVRTGTQEVTHDYELPASRQRLTDVFNFETRLWRATVRDMDGKGMTHNIVFFDDMPDLTVAQNALKKLRELGGTTDEDTISGQPLAKKRLTAGLR